MVTLQLFLVPDDLSVKLVREQVDRGVHVRGFGVGEQFGAGDTDGGFGLLRQLFDAEDHLHAGDVVKVALHARQFALDVLFQGRGDFHMMPADSHLHKTIPRVVVATVEENLRSGSGGVPIGLAKHVLRQKPVLVTNR